MFIPIQHHHAQTRIHRNTRARAHTHTHTHTHTHILATGGGLCDAVVWQRYKKKSVQSAVGGWLRRWWMELLKHSRSSPGGRSGEYLLKTNTVQSIFELCSCLILEFHLQSNRFFSLYKSTYIVWISAQFPRSNLASCVEEEENLKSVYLLAWKIKSI